MVSALPAAPAADANVTDDVVAVTSEVESVTEAATKALPSAPVPIETPDVPKAPPPPAVSKPPPSSAPPPASPAEAPVRDLGKKPEGVTRVAPETGEPAALVGSGARSEPDAPATKRGPDKSSIGPAETAPLLRWRAYVWPAIALRVGDALKPLLGPLDDLVRVHVPDVFELISSPVAHGSVEVKPPAERSGLLGQDRQSPGLALPGDGMDLVAALLIGLLMAVGLVALARLVVGEELFESRYWRGHRG